MKKTIVAVLALAGSAGLGYAAGIASAPDISKLNPKVLKYVLPQNVEWKPAAGLDKADAAVLVGDPAKPGFYIQLNRFHPGGFSRPHYHANDRYIMVISGTWWASTSATYDPDHNTVPIKPGTFVTHVGREVHYDGNRASEKQDTVVMIFGEGPGARIECEGDKAETGPGPCTAAKAVHQ